MDFAPKTPTKSHIRKGTVIKSHRKGSWDFDTEMSEKGYGEREADPARTGRGQRSATGDSIGSGHGRRMGVELVPKPSAEKEDPLNWSRTRREIAYFSLILTIASLAPLKTMLLTVSAVVATQLNVSYAGATALTGVPLVLGALSGLGARILSHSTGKRGFILSGSVLALLGALWNMHVGASYAQFLVSRIFQGIGWGFVEALGPEVVRDMFFVHQRKSRMVAYNIISLTFLWGSPILGGFLSQSHDGYANQIMLINILQAFSILSLILALPETTFCRPSTDPMFIPFGVTTTATVTTPTKTGFRFYLSTLKLSTPHSKSPFSIFRALKPIKALAAPSTILTTLLTAPLLGAALGSAHSISLLFSAMPTFLFPARIGYIFTLPFAFAVVFYALATLASYLRCKPPRHLSASIQGTELAVSSVGMVLALVGLLAWGLYTVSELDVGQYSDEGSVFSLSVTGLELSLRKVSLLLGVLVGGATVLSYSGNNFLASSLSGGDGNGDEMAAAHRTGEEILAGIWVCGMSGWIAGDSAGLIPGLRSTVLALGVVGAVGGSSVLVGLWVKGRDLGKVDARVLSGEDDALERDGGNGGKLNRRATGGSFDV